ncbi:MAG TPA: hypothetical protein VMH20_06905 [Verrucomicrobiae bacterium]|nr:hypothetical protein [Verrucomicrobiae bacterium]
MTMRAISGSVMAFLVLALVCCTPLLRAQSPDQGSGSQSANKPGDTPAQASPSTTPEKKKPKKVWTNDEIGSVKSTVSVVGNETASPTSAPAKPSSTDAGQARQQLVDSFRERIRNYQSQIDAIDQRIAQLKNFKADNTSPSGGININHGYDMVPLEDQVKQLEEQKKKLQGKLDDTEAEARKNGIAPGELR